MITTHDVTYDDRHQLTVDFYAPDTQAKAGVIVIHGGGWFRGDKAKEADWASRLVADGYFAIVPNYRQTPSAYYPAPLEDMDRLLTWLTPQALPFPAGKLAVVGASAGGNMAVELALKYGLPAVSLSGILDLEAWLTSHQAVVAKEGDTENFATTASSAINQDGQNDSFYKWFTTNYLPDPAMYAQATPANHVTPASGPLYLANSLHEFVPTSGVLAMAQALTAVEVPYVTRMLTGTRHGKGYLDDVYPDTERFIAQALGLA